MATVTISLNRLCSGQSHVHFNVSLNGGAVREYPFTVQDLREPLTQDDRDTIIRGLLRLHQSDRTLAQFRADVQAGINISTARA